MLKILLVEDEKNIRIGLVKMLELINIPHTIVGEAASVKDAKVMISENEIDLVLLDIELKDGSGFDLLKQLESTDFKVIFITAFNQYAIKAFKFNALDYLLKPVDPLELKTALIKVQESVQTENELQNLLQNFEENKTNETPKIVIKTSDRTHFIPIDGIQYCQSDGAYTKIFATDETVFASRNLKHFEELLSSYSFLRTHQSYLVNKLFISGFKNNVILLKDDTEIPVSSRKKSAIKKLLLKK